MRALSLAVALMIAAPAARAADEPVDFDRDVRPILAAHCFACHGPDEGNREAGLRLDRRENALAKRESGSRAIVPKSPEASELVRRVESRDEFTVMPPPDAAKPLSDEQKRTLRRWVAEGADYARHWAFVPPERPEPPDVRESAAKLRSGSRGFGDWSRSPVDAFVLNRLNREDWTPSPQADPRTLIRRVSLDLTGLPPTPEEVEAFAQNPTREAYEEVVDRLLASPHFGERMAMFWLDAARYSDTDGFQQDATRTNWPWRDWVTDAFNDNLPFDRFTLLQFAGDLLPDATAETRLATCFHRNHMTNGEGGRDPEESRIDYVIDRVNTTGTVWLGMTLGCCQCHSHKYDPISHAEFYRLNAFFDGIAEDGRAGGGAKPFLEFRSDEVDASIAAAESWLQRQRAERDAVRKATQPRFEDWLAERAVEVEDGFDAWLPLSGAGLRSRSGTTLTQTDDGTIVASGADPHHEDYFVTARAPQRDEQLRRITGLKLEILPHESHTSGAYSRSESGHFILSDVKLRLRSAARSQVDEVAIAEARADYSADPGKNGGYGNVAHTLDDDPRNGWASFGSDVTQPRIAVFRLEEPLAIDADDELVVELQQRALQGRHNIGRFRISVTDQLGETPRSLDAAPLEDLAAAGVSSAADVDGKLRERLFAQFLADDAEHVAAQRDVDRAESQLAEFRRAAGDLKVMVLEERKEPRETHVLIRGVWNAKGETVDPGAPAAILPWPEDLPRNRLGLAKWLTDRRNPLTARVTVNHFWGLLFGSGLVRTPEDFGVQGERPTHPELLDWLAVEFVETGWDVKRVLRRIVTSETYKQRSDAARERRERDPDNRLLARGSRFRLPSWMIRDAMLHASGLLDETVGGPPVRPYQPAGVWADITMGRFHYEPSVGPARYRRTVYAFWRRSAAPTFLFDSANRRVCEVTTPTTNTPLHALTLLNDLTTVEASRALAANVMSEHDPVDDRLRALHRRVVSRNPDERERAILRKQYETALEHYRAHPGEADRYLALGQSAEFDDLDSAELAATSVVAGLVFNLDQAVTRQ